MVLIPTMPKLSDDTQYSEVDKEWGVKKGYRLGENGWWMRG
jgi:hypothetical protein